MQLIHHPKELDPGHKRVCLAIGMFDGVHLGHQQVIRQAIADAHQHEAASVAVTFDCHPSTVVHPARVPPLIQTLSHKLQVIASFGVDAIYLIHFDLAFSRTKAEDFIRGLARDFPPIHSICVGSRFTFGHKRAGHVPLLQELGKELQFFVHGLAAVSLDNTIVSSTRIREAILEGNLDAASQMLGRPYSIRGKVIPGDHLGRQLGFPTANLDIASLALPPTGVYAAHALCNNHNYRAVVNVGYRPTIQQSPPQLRLEAHLLDFEGDLYGQELELIFAEKLRPEQKFSSPEALKEQINRDILAARTLFE